MARKPKTFKKESISVAFAVEQLQKSVGLSVKALNAGDADTRLITESNLHRPGMALAGYLDLFTHQRVQVLGNTECQFLANLEDDKRIAAFNNILKFPIPCIICTEGNVLDDPLLTKASSAGVPVYVTNEPSTKFMYLLRDFLEDQFAPQQSLHGSLVDVYGIGLLIIGPAGIGKSEVALDLVERGHRLVADDVVMATRKEGQVLMGSGTDLVQHFMEIRGLGLVDVRAMFGIRAIRFQKRIEVVVNLHPWDPDEEYTRLGMVDETYDILGAQLPLVMLPITPGKNVTVLCEVIAMNHLLRHYGYDPAEVFAERLAERIRKKGSPGAEPGRGIEYFEHDYE
ncbi:MAG: HPr(Ser) kinase/phosphatase [Bacteroidota bacterium]|nr:HPr(Ser) kinase/phosphatase [Bacteroidota bacterium]